MILLHQAMLHVIMIRVSGLKWCLCTAICLSWLASWLAAAGKVIYLATCEYFLMSNTVFLRLDILSHNMSFYGTSI